MFYKRDNIEFARWMRRGSMLFLAEWNSMCSGSEERIWSMQSPIVLQLEQRGCGESQEMILEGGYGTDYNRPRILAGESDFYCILGGK